MRCYDIAILLGFPEISGGTNVILEHALGLTRRGHSVSILTEQPFDPRRLSWKPAAMDLPRLSRADCAARRFDLAMATWWRSVYDLPFADARCYAYFCQSIESRFLSAGEPDIKALVDYTYRQPLPIVTEAAWIAAHLHKHYGREVTIVRNGIDKELFRSDGPTIEPRPARGLRLLVEGPLGVSFKRVELTIELCQRAGVEDLWLLTSSPCARYPGVRRVFAQIPMSQVGAVYRSCDVLVKLSTVEGMFGPPLEMMHCGGTAITTDVTGHEEYLRHGENGLIVRRGEESEVVDYLRALQRDRALLDSLKAGAMRTAAAWPDWSQSTDAMERFVRSVCECEVGLGERHSQMRQHLEAALRLAGPLHEAVKPDYSGRQLLRLAAGKAKRKLLRKLGLSRPVGRDEPLPEPARAAATVSWTGWPSAKDVYRIGFVANRRRFDAHLPTGSPRAATFWLDVPAGSADVDSGSLQSFDPDFVFVFEPETFEPAWLQRLPGFVLGVALRPLTPTRIAALRTRFPANQSPRHALLHPDTRAVLELRTAGVAARGTFLPPTDQCRFGRPLDFDQWRRRDIAVLLLGPATEANRPCLTACTKVADVVHISEPPADSALRGVLGSAKIVLHLPDADDRYVDSAKVVRDMMSGCLVLAGELAVDYGLMPSEHYLFFEQPQQLTSLVQQQLARPDPLDVIRRNGYERACLFDAGQAYVSLIERLGGPLRPGGHAALSEWSRVTPTA